MKQLDVEDRASLLRTFTRGVGWLFSHTHYKGLMSSAPDSAADSQVLLGQDADFYVAAMTALDWMPESAWKSAIENALGAGSFRGRQLAARRANFSLEHNISERTLLRHEARGALELLHFLDLALEPSKKKTSETGLDDMRREIAELRETVAYLQNQIGQKATQ